MPGINELCTQLTSYLNEDQIHLIRQAYDFAAEAHKPQFRKTGEPYITHPLAAANILADMHMDTECLIAALLHDTIEDTPVTKQDIIDSFGEEIAELVEGVTKLTHMEAEGDTKEELQAESILKMTLAMSKDLRVILVKLADRLHNMRTLYGLRPDKSRRIARETLEIYAPIAQRLGINDIRIELEDRGFKAQHPLRAERLAAALEKARKRRKDVVFEVQELIQSRFERENMRVAVAGREKHLYSIYKKMKIKKLAFKDIMDVFAFRIIVETVDDCYRALGIVHNLFKPVPGAFKDYIAIPKTNGYQSLHSILVGKHGVPIEVQIRTQEMDDMASYGIAAHWAYKTNGGSESGAVSSRASEWVQRLLDLQQEAGNPLEFIEHMKVDLFPDEIYVFTPKGRIIQLPAGATPVDFAFTLHTNIGLNCVGCKINGRPAPLSEKLESGQRIEILRAPKAQPHPGWLKFVVTGKARSGIRHALKNQRHDESIALGRRLINKALAPLKKTIEDFSEEHIANIIKDSSYANLDALLENTGLGNILPRSAARLLVEESEYDALATDLTAPIVIDSPDTHVISFGRCCLPIPGDDIVAYFSSGRGLVVHRDGCHNIQDLFKNPEKGAPVSWAADITGEFMVELWLEVSMFRGAVAQLASRITELEAGIENISITERGSTLNVLKLKLRVTDRVHLATIMRRVKLLPFVESMRRGSNV